MFITQPKPHNPLADRFAVSNRPEYLTRKDCKIPWILTKIENFHDFQGLGKLGPWGFPSLYLNVSRVANLAQVQVIFFSEKNNPRRILEFLVIFSMFKKTVQSSLTCQTLAETGHLSLPGMSRSHHRILLFNSYHQDGRLPYAETDSQFWSHGSFYTKC